MTAVRRRVQVTAAEIFRELCSAWAIVYAADEIDLHEVVDALQAYAERTGLVHEIGQTAAQKIMGEIFVDMRRHE
jgi:hypothetical protein